MGPAKLGMGTIAWVALAACSCPSGQATDAGAQDAGPMVLAEVEPNDRPDQAQPLASSAIVTGQLAADPSKPDEDWFQLESARPQSVELTVTGLPGGDVSLEVMDADRNRLALVNSEGEGKGERLPNLGIAGKVLVRVTSAKRGSGGSYQLTAIFSERAGGYEVEPNDRAVDAHVLQLGETVSGFVGHAADEDWYRFELPLPEGTIETALPEPDAGEPVQGPDAGTEASVEAPKIALKLDVSGVEGVRLDVSVLSAAEAPLFQIKGKDDEGLSLRNIGVRATDRLVFVVVKSAWAGTGKDARRGYNASRAYALTVAQEEAGANAEFEPNDELTKATPLPRDGYREGFLSPKTDVDYFVLRTEVPVLAKVHLSGVERIDSVLSMVKPPESGTAEQVLLKSNDGAVKEPEMLNNVFCAGECWFKVEGNTRKVDGKWLRDFENPDVPYRITVTTVSDDGGEEREPNGAAESATSLALGRAMRGTIHPKKDVDYYRLDLTGRPVKTALKATLIGILKVDVGLYVHELGEDSKLSLVQTADRAKGDQPETIRFTAEPGIYLFEVRDSSRRFDANFQDSYQLTVEEGTD